MPDRIKSLSGPTRTKVSIAVLGDGCANGADQTLYNDNINDLLFNGLFKNDYYFENKQAFNVFRVNLISVPSGVGTKTYNNGTLLKPYQERCARVLLQWFVVANSWWGR
jgi:IgA Peptidase M64